MKAIRSFPPIARPSARLLILGSMPGEASLAAGQYYAHPKNQFWRIIGEISGVGPDAPYARRTQALKACGFALWDVLKSCRRAGSLDSGIDEESICPNDFKAFFRKHPGIVHVYFNGGMAERCFRKYVLASLGARAETLRFKRLPSTSPANASWSPGRKRKAWAVLGSHGADGRQGL